MRGQRTKDSGEVGRDGGEKNKRANKAVGFLAGQNESKRTMIKAVDTEAFKDQVESGGVSKIKQNRVKITLLVLP